jgi:VanZ family protein
LGGLVVHALIGTGIQRHRWWAMVVVALYAISDEVHQAFIPGRSPSLLDVGIDSVGGFMGMQLLVGGWLDRGLAAASGRLRRAPRDDAPE